jgi:hypothetical protein
MRISSAFPSKYIKAADLQDRDWSVTLKAVEMETMEQTGEEKPVLYFVESDRGLVLNVTNATTIATKLGDDTDVWEGKSVVLYSATTSFSGRTVPCIRVRVPDMPVGVAPQSPSVGVALTTGPSDDVPF